MQGCDRRTALRAGASALLAISGCGWLGDEVAVEPEIPKAATLPVAQVETLELHLKVGDRFPLKKTVTQELHQASAIGPAISHTELELLLTLHVEEVLPDRKRLGVRYNRVKYSQDMAGEKFSVDSSRPEAGAPSAAMPYLGLVDNGFSFWVGRDNQIIEPIGFPEFLERCVRSVPESERKEVLRQFAQSTADEGVANFVDDSIGLLPYEVDGKEGGTGVTEGDTWTRDRRLMLPMPLYLQTRYTLRSLTPKLAEIDVLGKVSPAATPQDEQGILPVSAETEPRGAKKKTSPDIVVRGGKAFGSCTIDRATGLPLESKVERFLEMNVRLPNGLSFEQRKRTVTTIQAFPQQAAVKRDQ